MRSILIIFIIKVAVGGAVSKQQSTVRLLHPEDAGAMHTEAFETLADMYSVKKPTSRLEMMNDSRNILASFCKEGDSDCHSNAHNITVEHFNAAENGPREIVYPDDLDSKIVESMEKVKSSIQRISTHDVDHVVSELASIRNEIENMNDVNTGYKTAALCGVSIASESVKLWYKTYSDPKNSLYGIHYPSFYFHNNTNSADNGRRNTRTLIGNEEDGPNVSEIAMADFGAGVSAAMSKPNFNAVSIIAGATANAIPASLSVTVLNGQDDKYYDDDDTYYGDNDDDYYAGRDNDDDYCYFSLAFLC